MNDFTIAGFEDEMEKISVNHKTVGRAFEALVGREMKVPHQVRDLAEGIVRKAHPRFKSWYLRTTPVGRS